MSCTPEANRDEDESPVHPVELDGFWMGKHEVTNRQFARFVSTTGYRTDVEKRGQGWGWDRATSEWKEQSGITWKNPGWKIRPRDPVVLVSWRDAGVFCQWMNQGRTGEIVRLPTEAEWEYACRAGTTTAFQWGNDPNAGEGWLNAADETRGPDGQAWMEQFYFRDGYWFVAPAGAFKPNAFGLYDMHGNIWEWCADWYAADYYYLSPLKNPPGPASGQFRVLRGGSWDSSPPLCRSANRNWGHPHTGGSLGGFRVVCVPGSS